MSGRPLGTALSASPPAQQRLLLVMLALGIIRRYPPAIWTQLPPFRWHPEVPCMTVRVPLA